MMENEQSRPNWWRRRNWWKIGFFVMLFAFELAREWAVLASAQEAWPNVSYQFDSYDGFTKARGVWKRIDKGDKLVPVAVTIECRRELNQCVEMSTSMRGNSVFAPEAEWFDATFSADGISYQNTNPVCVTYAVRIDTRMEKVFAVRTRKPNPNNEMCKEMEPRIESQLADGFDNHDFDAKKGHFVPIVSLISAILEPRRQSL